MLFRRIGVMIVLSITLIIFIGVPYLTLLIAQNSLHQYMSPRNKPDPIQQTAGVIGLADVVQNERIFNIDGEEYYGQRNNLGYSVAVMNYSEGFTFSAKDKYLKVTRKIKAHREGMKLVLVFILMANDSTDDGMDTHSGFFTLEREGKTYQYDIMALHDLQACDIGKKREKIQPGEMTIIVVPFAVPPDEDVDSMKLGYFPSLFTPKVYVPLTGHRRDI